MKLHPNAKTTPHSRLLLVRRIEEEGWDPASAAEAVGVSRRCAFKWLARYRSEGLDGLQDRPCTPHRIPHKTSRARERRIRQLRLRRLPAFQIARLLDMARSTVSAVLERLGLNRLKALEPREPANSYERSRPGELIHLDIKKLGRFARAGHRVHGDRTRCTRGVGWEFVHVCVDDYSRVAYVEVLGDEKGPTAAGFLERAVRWFGGLGVQVERVLTDNGSCYKSGLFRTRCQELGITPKRTRPYCPRTNGKAERFIQTMLREWAYARAYASSNSRRRGLQPWLNRYNRVRPHGSLDFLAPMTRISGSG